MNIKIKKFKVDRTGKWKKIIKVEQFEKHFGNQVDYPPLSLDIKGGRVLTILGRVAAGKTTLLLYDRRIWNFQLKGIFY